MGPREKNRKWRPSGRKTGKRWEIWSGGLRRVAGARPRPSAAIRMIGVDGDGENRIVPSAFQLPAVPCVALAKERTRPDSRSTRFICAREKKPSDLLSGDQNR